MINKKTVCIFVTALALTGCGGGGGGGSSDSSSANSGSTTPDAPAYNQAHLKSDNALGVIATGFDGSGVTVAVMDTGIDKNHVEFKNTSFGTGYDALANDGDRTYTGDEYTDTAGHGTPVASLIGGQHVGIAPGATLISYKTSVTEQINTTNQIEALKKMLSRGDVKIVNVSSGLDLAPDNGMNEVRQAVLKGINDQDWIVVVSANNNGGGNSGINYGGLADDPAFKGHIITVGAGDEKGHLASYSATATSNADSQGNFGSIPGVIEHFLVAPGSDSTASSSDLSGITGEKTYSMREGTSFAAPQVSGAAAVIESAYPSLSAKQVVDVLLKSATDIGDKGVDGLTGSGKLNLRAAMDLAQQEVQASSAT